MRCRLLAIDLDGTLLRNGAPLSFVMGHAPAGIVRAVRRKLQATAASGDAIAELLQVLSAA